MEQNERLGMAGKVTAVILAIVLSLGFTAMPVYAATEASAAVKVGVFTGTGYAEKDKTGTWTGMDVEIIENIAQTAGFRVKFVVEDSAEQAFDDLDNGKIDMLADVAKTAEREQRLLFSDYEQGSVGTSIFVRKSDDRWDYGEVDQIKTMKFSCEKGNIVAEDFKTWCSQYDFKPDITYYQTLKAAEKAVKNKKVDAFIDGEDFVEGYRTVLTFAPSPYYFVFSRDKVKLKTRVDSAMAEIYQQDPLYQQELQEKYFGLTQEKNATFTKTEKAYIKSKKVITVAVLKEDQPYFSGTELAPDGIVPDYYKQLAKATGLKFKYKTYEDNETAIAAVKTGAADVIGIYSDGLTQAYSKGLNLTRKYISVNAVMITRAKTKTADIGKIAVKGRSIGVVSQGIPDSLKNSSLISYNTASDCFQALRHHTADAAILGVPSATYLINQVNPSGYSLTPVSSVDLGLCAATASGNRILISVMNKGINSTSYAVNGIIADNTVSKDSIQTAVAKIPAIFILIFTGIMILFIIFLIWSVVRVSRSKKREMEVLENQARASEERIKAEAAEKSAAEKNAFFSNISHDMRTPLNAVIGFSRLAKNETDAAEKDKYLEKIQSSGELLNSLIDDTLTLSKANSSKLELNLAPLATDEFIRVISESVRTTAEQKGIDFSVDVSGFRQRMIVADKLNLQKIFLNLLSNAVKFTKPGGHVFVRIYDDPGEKADPDLVVVIEDDGIGMNKEYMQHMFEPFSQEKRHGYESVGTGLGLSIVKELVDLMHGKIDVTSELGKGTTFTVRLNFEEGEPAADVDNSRDKSTDVDLKGKRILVCEDNSMNTEIAKMILVNCGAVVLTAENGRAGLEIFSSSEPGSIDAILMDVRMPVMDGYEATRAITRPGPQRCGSGSDHSNVGRCLRGRHQKVSWTAA
jgi:signal transduction histidine kinase